MRRTRQCCIFRSRKAINQSSGTDLAFISESEAMAVPGPKFGGDSRICAHTLCECGGPLLFSGSGRTVCGMENFIQVFHSQAFRLAVKNTLHFILVCIPVLMAFHCGLPFL